MKKLVYILLIIYFAACRSDDTNTGILVEPNVEQIALIHIPEGFPEMEFPKGNELTKDRWELGKKLFYEKKLSVNNSISCGSCHKPTLAFADNSALSPGVFNRAGIRNSPALANVGYHPYLLREGSVPTLEMQVLVPIQEHNEFDHNIVEIAEELQKDSDYVQMSKLAYDRIPDAFVITRALSNFQRTMVSGNSNYDKYVNKGNKAALNESEKNGMQLFFSSKTNCSSCHSGFNFTNYAFENNGLDSVYADNGRQRLTNNPSDEALFKVPSIRNIGLTAPYMHDGRFVNLEQVVNHYNDGGKNHVNKSSLIRPLNLTNKEKGELIAFLNSLSDFEFVNDPKWENGN